MTLELAIFSGPYPTFDDVIWDLARLTFVIVVLGSRHMITFSLLKRLVSVKRMGKVCWVEIWGMVGQGLVKVKQCTSVQALRPRSFTCTFSLPPLRYAGCGCFFPKRRSSFKCCTATGKQAPRGKPNSNTSQPTDANTYVSCLHSSISIAHHSDHCPPICRSQIQKRAHSTCNQPNPTCDIGERR